jgi:hypothetical protein
MTEEVGKVRRWIRSSVASMESTCVRPKQFAGLPKLPEILRICVYANEGNFDEGEGKES